MWQIYRTFDISSVIQGGKIEFKLQKTTSLFIAVRFFKKIHYSKSIENDLFSHATIPPWDHAVYQKIRF